MLGANVFELLVPPPSEMTIVGSDGLWGVHEWTIYPQLYCLEFPYLSWISLPSINSFNILTCPVEKTMWELHGHKTNAHIVTPALLNELTTKWGAIKDAVQGVFKATSSSSSFSSVQIPKEAYFRASVALSRLEDEFEAWRDFVEVYRNLQRALLELSAYLDWWKDVSTGDFQPSVRPPTRGAIFEDENLYSNQVCYSVRAFLLIHKSTFTLDPTKKVELSLRNQCKLVPLSLKSTGHTLQHWYYPPQVKDIVVDMETTARGYAVVKHLDTFNPIKEFKCRLEKVDNQMNNEGKLTYVILSFT